VPTLLDSPPPPPRGMGDRILFCLMLTVVLYLACSVLLLGWMGCMESRSVPTGLPPAPTDWAPPGPPPPPRPPPGQPL
jgi:hypothetical protein